jgi:hypothetical protein
MLIYILKMSSEDALNESNLKLDYLVLKQAIRDLASKDNTKSDEAFDYFHSEHFALLCERVLLDKKVILKSVVALTDYPLISRKKLANSMAKEIDKKIFS